MSDRTTSEKIMRVVATAVAVAVAVAGLVVVGFFIFMAIALNAWGSTK